MDASRAFRDALARYPTGVALVTLFDGERARAMTVNSFASVSLDPPLVLWSLARSSQRYDVFLNARRYAFNVLAADQEALSTACAKDDDLAKAGAEWSVAREEGAPLVDGAVARFDCARRAVHPGGDHDIIVGEVLGFDTPRDAPALVFHQSRYARAG